MRPILLACVTALFALGAGDSTPTPVHTITTGHGPCGAVAAFDSVWIANDGGTLVRINPRTNRIVRRFRTGRGSCSLTAGAGALWIANYKEGLVRVSPSSGRVRRISVGAIPFDVLFAFGRMWVTTWGDGKVAVVSPRTLRVIRRIAVGAKPSGLIARAGAVWVGFGVQSSIARIDPGDASVKRIDVGEWAPSWFVAGAKDLWIQANGGDVVHVDPMTRQVLAHMHIGRTLAQGAVASDGTIWMPDKEQSIVYRIDPVGPRVRDSFPAGPGAYVALRAYGSMWVTSYAGTAVWRYSP